MIRPGQTGEFVYFLLEGVARIFHTNDAREFTAKLMEAPNHFGDIEQIVGHGMHRQSVEMSTDATLAVAPTSGLPVFTQVYTGASRQDATGDWKLWDFAKARNVFVDEIERRGADFVLWMDADDELLTPAAFSPIR